MPGRRINHVITPGDHYSPRTGSAIPTVVDGLARAAERGGAPRHSVVIDESTYQPRYDSADVIEYVGAEGAGRLGRYVDAARGRVGLARTTITRSFAPAAAALRGQPPSIVFAHNAPVLARLLRDTGHTVVLYAHNDLFRTYGRREARAVMEGVSCIVCVSEALAERTRSRLPDFPAQSIHVVGNGVDIAQFTPVPNRRPGPIRIAFMGRLVEQKGPDTLLRAASELGSLDAEILVIGRAGFAPDAPLTDYERELRQLATASAVPVRFTGFVPRPELADALRDVDIFVMTSRWHEAAPLTIGEALATGLPTIASRLGGIPEMLGNAGVLVNPDDPSSLANELQRLAIDPAERARLAKAARTQAETHDWSWSWRQLSGVIDGL